MCGIYAQYEAGVVKPPSFINAQLLRMKYRGPDATRSVQYAKFSIGFNRLAIVDTTSPHAEQPRVTNKGRVICLNGEIYNYHRLDPNALSEVALLDDMLDAGVDPRSVIDGDYAILYYDPSNREVTLYRDRFGVCPLYYQLKPYLAVSSEACLLINPREVKPHEKVRIRFDRTGRARVYARDTMKHYGLIAGPQGVDSDETFFALFLEAVQTRALHSDAGFSVTCSGGLDSSAVVLALRYLGLIPDALLCVTAGETEDLRCAQLVAEQVGMPLTVIDVRDGDVFRDALQIQRHLDIPSHKLTGLGWRVAVRDWFVAKHAKTKVVLTGEGADELFEGYPPHADRLKLPYLIAHKQLSQLRSLPFCSLNFSNKIGLAHSKEFRAPFLQSTLSYWLLATNTGPRKQLLRKLLTNLRAPEELLQRSKWGKNEERLDASVKEVA